MKKVFFDGRRFKAPYGQFSQRELDALVTARTAPTKNHPAGRPLGRNAILLWLFVVNRASSRRRQGFTLHETCLIKLIPKASSRYEAWKDLKHTGYIQQSLEHPEKWFLSIPGLSEVSEFDDDSDSETSESEEENKEDSEKTGTKLRTARKDTTSTETNYRITEGTQNSEKPLFPKKPNTEHSKEEKKTPYNAWLNVIIQLFDAHDWNKDKVPFIVDKFFTSPYSKFITVPSVFPYGYWSTFDFKSDKKEIIIKAFTFCLARESPSHPKYQHHI